MAIDLKETVESLLNQENLIAIYEEIIKEPVEYRGANNWAFHCPFHNEQTASFIVDFDNKNNPGVYHCMGGCNASGNVYTLLKKLGNIEKPLLWLADRFRVEYKKEKYLTVPAGEILDAKENLRKNKTALDRLIAMGISEQTIDKYNIGYSSYRYWFPVEENGVFVDVRKYDPDDTQGFKVIGYAKDYGKTRLIPAENLNANRIYYFEGEKDMFTAISLGYNAITNTCGAKSFPAGAEKRFKNKEVIICLDIDEAGIDGAEKRAHLIAPYASMLKIIKLPLDTTKYPHGDFNDYIIKEGHTKEDFDKLVDETEAYIPISETETLLKLTISEASKPKYVGEKSLIQNVVVIGKDQSPFSVPKNLTIKCAQNKDSCATCKGNSPVVFNIPETDEIVVEMSAVPKDKMKDVIKARMRLKCKFFDLEVHDYYNVERYRVAPNVIFSESSYEYCVRTAYYVTDEGRQNKKIETNRVYDIKAVTIPDPKNQAAVHLTYDIGCSDTNLDEFRMTPEIHETLQIFKPKEYTVNGIEEFLNEKYKEFGIQARIYGREDLIAMYDLTWHSVINFNFQGEPITKGWVESCVIGDSGCGKTKLAKFMLSHYRLGGFVDGEGATLAGLKGGLSQINGQWTNQWGKFPMYDRRLLVIDEAGGLKVDEIGQLSSMRSSGICIQQKVIQDQTMARTRAIFMANPRRENTGIHNYVHGVTTIKDFFGKPEDVRRCDVAFVVAANDVSQEIINQEHKVINAKYTSGICYQLVLFAWTLGSDRVIIPKETEEMVLKHAMEMGKKYSASIPLVEPADIRNKLIRLSVSLAVITYSVNEEYQLIVLPAHVEYVAKYLNRIYSNPRMAYDRFSAMDIRRNVVLDPNRVLTILGIGPDGFDLTFDEKKMVVEELLHYSLIDKDALKDLLAMANPSKTHDTAGMNKLIMELRKNNCIDSMERKFKLNPGFLDLLRAKQKEFEGGEENLFNQPEGTIGSY